jgi:hypothetical protein
VQVYDRRATLRIEPTAHPADHRLFTLTCKHGTSEALTNNAPDGEVLAYLCAFHEAEEGCGCAESVLSIRPP